MTHHEMICTARLSRWPSTKSTPGTTQKSATMVKAYNNELNSAINAKQAPLKILNALN